MKKLRLGKDKIFLGVCSGIAEYFDTDPNIVRLCYILLTLLLPEVFIPFYFIAYVLLRKEENCTISEQSIRDVVLMIFVMIITAILVAWYLLNYPILGLR